MNIPASHELSVSRTARYYTLGSLSDQTKEIWIVLHGYAQLASEFIKPFTILDDATRFIVAPEALNRFYARGFGGNPVATWMTSEMRENEIKDYILYLDILYRTLRIDEEQKKVVLLGFSQGVATASRWLNHTSVRVDELVIYAGEVAAELRNPPSQKLLSLPVTYITGDSDRLISKEKQEEVLGFMKLLNARIITFPGGHEIKPEVLQRLI